VREQPIRLGKRYTLSVLASTAAALLAMSQVPAAELSIWALQSDLRAAAGNPDVSLPPASIAFNPQNGKLLIACGGSNATIFEWARGASTGTVLVPRSQ